MIIIVIFQKILFLSLWLFKTETGLKKGGWGIPDKVNLGVHKFSQLFSENKEGSETERKVIIKESLGKMKVGYIYIADSLWCTLETNTILQKQLYLNLPQLFFFFFLQRIQKCQSKLTASKVRTFINQKIPLEKIKKVEDTLCKSCMWQRTCSKYIQVKVLAITIN